MNECESKWRLAQGTTAVVIVKWCHTLSCRS